MKKYIFISGATGGLGKAFAIDCARRGWNIFLTDINQDAINDFSAMLRKMYRVEADGTQCDLTDVEQREQLFDQIDQKEMHFDGLINVAGVDFEGDFLHTNLQQIRTILQLNIESTLDITHFLLRRRRESTPFHIITVASLAAFYPMPIKATYAASKRFLLNFYLALREELRPLNAIVTVLCPAGLATKPETITSIVSQGWMGEITTKDIGYVTKRTINKALRVKAIYIPGMFNQILRSASAIIPPLGLAAIINKRWINARAKITVNE